MSDSAESDQGLLADGLSFEAWMPMRLEEVEGEPSESDVEAANDTNQRLLQGLLLLDERPGGRERDEEGEERGAEIARLEGKLDLLIEMVSHLLGGDPCGLQPARVRLGARALQWQDGPGGSPAGALFWVDTPPGQVRLEWQSEAVTDLLETLIFRYHRRQVARLRARSREDL
ncbi:MAG: hypothetical protein AB2807_00095 [Candidatus Sedimenticola endophacoides]